MRGSCQQPRSRSRGIAHGESEPVLKDPRTLSEPAALGDRLNMVFNGTAVTQGVGRAVVTATGMATQMGQIADLLHATREDPTPLQREIARVGRMLGVAVVAIAVIVMATIFAFFGVDTLDDVVTALLLGVSLAVAAVPEGLPTVLSVVLALGVQRMAAHSAIVKELSSVETLGSASVVCSDKTGTLTQGEMTIGRVVTGLGEVEVTGAGYRPEGRVLHDGTPLEEGSALWLATAFVLSGGSLAGNATLQQQDGVWAIQGGSDGGSLPRGRGQARQPATADGAVPAGRRDPLHLRAQAHDEPGVGLPARREALRRDQGGPRCSARPLLAAPDGRGRRASGRRASRTGPGRRGAPLGRGVPHPRRGLPPVGGDGLPGDSASPSSRTWSTQAWSGSSIRLAPRQRRPSPRPSAPGSGS